MKDRRWIFIFLLFARMPMKKLYIVYCFYYTDLTIIEVAAGGMQKNKKVTAVIFSLSIVLFFLSSHCLAAEKTVGVIFTGDDSYYHDIHISFIARLRRETSAGKIEVITQKPFPDPLSLINSVRKLVAMDVDVIVAYGTPALLAAVSQKTHIPIVYAGVYGPFVQQVKAKNITGVSAKVSVSSLLRYLRSLTDVKTLGVFYSEHEADSVYQMKELRNLSGQYGIKVEAMNIKRPQEVRQVLSGKKRPDALFITGSSIVHMALPAIADYADGLKIPSVSLAADKISYAVISLSADPAEHGTKAAEKVIKVFGGISPAKISAETSSEVELTFNLRKAQVMGWKIPMELVASATRLIR
jgi:putative ABC transport system substrate-binding protein